jgi:hypothetical protein
MIEASAIRQYFKAGLFVICLASWNDQPVWAFNQPPVNLSATTFVDGGAPPGLYFVNYTIFTEGRKALDNDGNTIPGAARVNVLVQLNQLYWHTNVHFLGGDLGIDMLLPVVSPSVRGGFGPFPLTANTAGLGDFAFGPALQWDKGSLAGRPFFQRIETAVTFPTGKYDKNISVNPGSNLLTVDSYYSFVWFFSQKWETSLRLWYAFHGENDDSAFGKVKPGQLLHINYAISREIAPRLRLGAAGYLLTQTTEDTVNGVKSQNSKERAMAVGPGLVYMGNGLTMMLSHPIEFGVRNRFQGSRTTLQLIHRF